MSGRKGKRLGVNTTWPSRALGQVFIWRVYVSCVSSQNRNRNIRKAWWKEEEKKKKREGGERKRGNNTKIMKKSRGKKKGDFISRLLFISSQSNLFVRNN